MLKVACHLAYLPPNERSGIRRKILLHASLGSFADLCLKGDVVDWALVDVCVNDNMHQKSLHCQSHY